MSPGVLTGYRMLAWVTGVLLIVVVFVAMPLKYLAEDETLMSVIGPGHGFVYMVYVVFAFLVFNAMRWPLQRLFVLLLAGVVPFLSFFVERKVVRDVRATQAAPAAPGPPA